ncbi:hypothetical protein [Azospirillum sp. Sh1]|uniref:phage head-tail joining protein n=1 Tax=Azospirillum sp. Sh1 TaxID=2607285 RepID=UPI0011EE2C6F|nr:hypothetical protein [Azospirillum sp. Sh1]KAA0571083.1 hypothetical protein FZ029_27915 [Azospirillum sp. Sh1]
MSQDFTPEHLAALTKALSRGLRRVEHKGKVFEYQSLKEMLDLRDRMIRELNAQSEPRVMTRRTLPVRS